MPGALTHRGVRYAGAADLAGRLAPVLRAAARAGDAVAAALDPESRDAVVAELGDDADRVEFVDPTRPAHIEAFQLVARRAATTQAAARDGRRSVFVGQNQPALGLGDDYWLRLEAAVEHAFVGLPALLLCPYRTDAPALTEVHGVIDDGDGPHANRSVRAPEDVVRDLPPLTLPPLGCPQLVVEVDRRTLAAARRRLLALVDGLGLTDPPAEDLVYAVSEIATNAVEHGGGHGTVSVWLPDGSGTVVCEVADAGRLAEPFPGVRPPPREQERGRGLWLARTLCDAVDVRVDAEGTRVRLTVDATG